MLLLIKKSAALIIIAASVHSLVAQDPIAVRYTIEPVKLTSQEIMGGRRCIPGEQDSNRTPQRINGDAFNIEDHFLGAHKQESAQINTDTSGCVGTKQFLVCIKGRVRTFNKNTGAPDNVLNVSLDRFFRALDAGAFISDPRPQFDAHSKRWLIMAINAGGGAESEGVKGADEEDFVPHKPTNNLKKRTQAEEDPTITTGIPNTTRLLLAVSDSDIITPQTVWSFYILDTTIDKPDISFFDFETLGWDEDAVYVGSNPVLKNLIQDSNFYVIQKTSLLSGGPAAVSAFYNLSSEFNMFTLQPASNFDTGSHVGYTIARDLTSSRQIALCQVLNPGSLTPQLTAPVSVMVPRLGDTFTPPALGSVLPIGAFGDRFTSAPHIRNNQLWAVSDIGMDSTGQRPNDPAAVDRVGAGYFRIDVSNPSGPFVVAQSGSLFDPSTTTPPLSYFFSSIMTNSKGKLLIGSTVCGETERLNAAVSLLLDDQNSFETIKYTNSTTDFNPTDDYRAPDAWRWGDYSMVSLDPQDDKIFWAIEEYCFDTNTWGVEVAKVSVK